jgi:uncharacterized membrane protein
MGQHVGLDADGRSDHRPIRGHRRLDRFCRRPAHPLRDLRAVWVHAGGNAVALVLAIFNAFIHSRDAYTSVVPTGLILSALTVLILLVTGWMGWDMVYRHRVDVLENGHD